MGRILHMPSGRLRRADLPAAPGAGSGELVRGRAARPRARGVDSGSVSARQRPAVLGSREADESGYSRAEERSEGSHASAQELKARVLISEVLRGLGARTDFQARWTSVRCPFHDDRHASASFNDVIGQFYCHGCDVHGDIYDLVQTAEGISFPEAVAFIEREYG